MITLEWDTAKAAENLRKHGVSFEEAQTVFYDEHAKQFDDPDHSEDEEHFIMLGISEKLRILVVIHTFREADRVIRIISARKATRKEQKAYGGKGT